MPIALPVHYTASVTVTFSPRFPRALLDPEAVSIVGQLQGHGHVTYFVGGCVRDLLTGRRPKDFDIATDARPEDLKRLFGRRCRIIGRRFRLVHLHAGGQIYEVATFRGLPDDQEMADDESGFVVRANTFGTPLEDAKSRDFTVNGLFYDPVGHQVIDHVGGTADVERRLLRTIGDADKRLREDPVRLLRAIKFAARLEFSIDQAVIDASAEAAPLIATCPAARVAEELYRIAESGHARAAFVWMKRLGVLDALVPEIAAAFDELAPDLDQTLAWLDQLDRLTKAHGTLPREATFALFAWPFVWRNIAVHEDAAKLSWGRYTLSGIRELAIRLGVPVRHRHTLAGMADSLKRLKASTLPGARRPPAHWLRAYGVPLALTVVRMEYLIGGDGQAAYDLWAAELERMGLWAAPFEPRSDDDDAPPRRERARGQGHRPAAAAPIEPAAARTDEREPEGEGGAAAPKRRRRRRKRNGGGPDVQGGPPSA